MLHALGLGATRGDALRLTRADHAVRVQPLHQVAPIERAAMRSAAGRLCGVGGVHFSIGLKTRTHFLAGSPHWA